jgi:hypothetical protein
MGQIFGAVFRIVGAMSALCVAAFAFYMAHAVYDPKGPLSGMFLFFAGLFAVTIYGAGQLLLADNEAVVAEEDRLRATEVKRHLDKVTARHLAELNREERRKSTTAKSP